MIATLFGPIKYGILPDHLKTEELARRQCAGRRRDLHGDPARHHRRRPRREGRQSPGHVRRADHGVRDSCAGGRACSFRAPARARRISISIRNIARSTGALLKDLWSDSRLWWGGLVTSWFWLVGAVVLSLMPPLVKSVLGATEEVVTAYPRGVLDLDRDRLGSCGLARRTAASCCGRPLLGAGLLAPVRARPRLQRLWGGRRGAGRRRAGVHLVEGHLNIAIDLAGLAIAGGLFIVPSFAAVQNWAGADKRARVVAACQRAQRSLHRRRHAGRRRACRPSA